MFNSRQKKTPLFDAVKRYVESNPTRFHVPGHKGGRGLPELQDYLGRDTLLMDVNGMEGLDYLNNPTGVIQEAQQLFADAYNAQDAFFLVNGTTSGVQAMIMCTCEPGDKIIIPRNAHKSVIGGIILSNAVPVYIHPEVNNRLGIAMGITVDSIRKAMDENPDAKAIFLINPSYYGIAPDLKSITSMAHNRGIAVLVDEAHGAHLPFHPDFPLSAMEAGADLCAASIHKTAGSLTQSSILLLKGDRIAPENVKRMLNLTCTSSASYLLMCSLDLARKQLVTNGYKMLSHTLKIARYARDEINRIEGLYAFGRELVGTPGCFDFDETKLGVFVRGLGYTGYQIEKILRKEYNIQIELSDLYNILAITSIGDRFIDLDNLIKSLEDIVSRTKTKELKNITIITQQPEMVVLPREAFFKEKVTVPLEESIGKVSGEMVIAYPPGIPVICMGELITKEIVEYIKVLKDEKCELQGTADPHVNSIMVLKPANRYY